MEFCSNSWILLQLGAQASCLLPLGHEPEQTGCLRSQPEFLFAAVGCEYGVEPRRVRSKIARRGLRKRGLLVPLE
jgi:hypothetical protein